MLKKHCEKDNIRVNIKREMKGLAKALEPTDFELERPSSNKFWLECKYCGNDIADKSLWTEPDACCGMFKSDKRPKRNDANPDGAKCIRNKVKADDRRAATKIKGMKLV